MVFLLIGLAVENGNGWLIHEIVTVLHWRRYELWSYWSGQNVSNVWFAGSPFYGDNWRNAFLKISVRISLDSGSVRLSNSCHIRASADITACRHYRRVAFMSLRVFITDLKEFYILRLESGDRFLRKMTQFCTSSWCAFGFRPCLLSKFTPHLG